MLMIPTAMGNKRVIDGSAMVYDVYIIISMAKP